MSQSLDIKFLVRVHAEHRLGYALLHNKIADKWPQITSFPLDDYNTQTSTIDCIALHPIWSKDQTQLSPQLAAKNYLNYWWQEVGFWRNGATGDNARLYNSIIRRHAKTDNPKTCYFTWPQLDHHTGPRLGTSIIGRIPIKYFTKQSRNTRIVANPSKQSLGALVLPHRPAQ